MISGPRYKDINVSSFYRMNGMQLKEGDGCVKELIGRDKWRKYYRIAIAY